MSIVLSGMAIGTTDAAAMAEDCPSTYYWCYSVNTAHGYLVMYTRLDPSDHHERAFYRALGWDGDKVWMNWTKDNGRTWHEETEVTSWIAGNYVRRDDIAVWDGSPYQVQVCSADQYGNWLPDCTPWH
ncbi:hypothetical protein [Kitasatospora sp. NPDC006786]|uniref:hypothetical protein n=1 Tax=unclassified Kitasatospora TaxID=2633591 RepID=UPI0033C52F9A